MCLVWLGQWGLMELWVQNRIGDGDGDGVGVEAVRREMVECHVDREGGLGVGASSPWCSSSS